ncbi:MAG TPA: DUF2076 family protein, partial [Burkholderiaceae bacterium]
APAAPTPVPTGTPGFLGSAASTAAGIAGGMFLFNGLENLLGSHHGGGNSLFSGNQAATSHHDGNADSSLARDAGADADSFLDDGTDGFFGSDDDHQII